MNASSVSESRKSHERILILAHVTIWRFLYIIILLAFTSSAQSQEQLFWQKILDIKENDSPAIWKVYEESRGRIDDAVPTLEKETSATRLRAFERLIGAALVLNKAEVAHLFDGYMTLRKVEFAVTPSSTGIGGGLLTKLCEAGRLDLAARVIAFNDHHREAHKSAMGKNLPQSAILADFNRDLAANSSQMARSQELIFYEALGDWEAVARISQKIDEAFEKMTSSELPGKMEPEIARNFTAVMKDLKKHNPFKITMIDSKFRTGDLRGAETAIRELIDQDVKTGANPSIFDAYVPGLFSSPYRMRCRLLLLEILVEQGKIDEAEKVKDELELSVKAIAESLARMSKKPITMSQKPLEKLSTLKIRLLLLQGNKKEAAQTAQMRVDELASQHELSPYRISAVQNLAWLLEKDSALAHKVRADFNKAQAKLAAAIMMTGSENQKLSFLQASDIYSLSASAGDAPAVAALSMGFKGRVMESIVKVRSQDRNSGNKERRAAIDRLNNAEQALINGKLSGTGDLAELQNQLEVAQTEAALPGEPPISIDDPTGVSSLLNQLNEGEMFASSAKTVGGNRCLIAAKRRESLESCPQQAASRMGL